MKKKEQRRLIMSRYYLAVDIGASSGRHMLGHLEDGKMHLEEIYRFENGMAKKTVSTCGIHSVCLRKS